MPEPARTNREQKVTERGTLVVEAAKPLKTKEKKNVVSIPAIVDKPFINGERAGPEAPLPLASLLTIVREPQGLPVWSISNGQIEPSSAAQAGSCSKG